MKMKLHVHVEIYDALIYQHASTRHGYNHPLLSHLHIYLINQLHHKHRHDRIQAQPKKHLTTPLSLLIPSQKLNSLSILHHSLLTLFLTLTRFHLVILCM